MSRKTAKNSRFSQIFYNIHYKNQLTVETTMNGGTISNDFQPTNSNKACASSVVSFEGPLFTRSIKGNASRNVNA
jgi:hypothetical protein